MSELSTDLSMPGARPYFLWSEALTVEDLRRGLASLDREERLHWLTVLLREARDRDVWRFVTPAEVASALPEIAPRLGRRRALWEYLVATWSRDGLLPK